MDVVSVLKNKVVFYLASRYITYAIQFITSLLIAAELGPYYMGIWGFILLILQYFQQFHFGIANSFNVLYVHHKDNEQECNNYIGNSLLLVSYLTLLVVCFYLYYVFVGINSLEKYHADKYVIWICLIALMQYFVQFFINLFRVKNQLNRVTFCQSIIVLLNFACVFFFRGDELIKWLVAGYVVGNAICVILALTSGTVPFNKKVKINVKYQLEILKKGLFLFLYNSCFYFIIISVRTIISSNYSVDEFGMFTFSYTLAHAFLLIMEALTFIVFPKIIYKLSSKDYSGVAQTITMLRKSYITSAHLLIYGALICFPVILLFLPQYSDSLTCLNLIALTILMSANSFSYLELLISNNKECLMAQLSAIALLINGFIACVFVYMLQVSYSYVIIATMITYYFYTLSIVKCGNNILKKKSLYETLKEQMPLRLVIPYLVAIIITILQFEMLIGLPLVVFLMFNFKELKSVIELTRKLLIKPEVVNL